MSKVKFSKKIIPLVVIGTIVASGSPKTVFAATPKTTTVSTTSEKLTTAQYLELVKAAANSNNIEDFRKLGICSAYTHKPLLVGATQEQFLEFKNAVNRLYNLDLKQMINADYLNSQDVKDLNTFISVLGEFDPKIVKLQWKTSKELGGDTISARWHLNNGVNIYFNEDIKQLNKSAFMDIYFNEATEILAESNGFYSSELGISAQMLKSNKILKSLENNIEYVSEEYTDRPAMYTAIYTMYTLNKSGTVSDVNNCFIGQTFPKSFNTYLSKDGYNATYYEKQLVNNIKNGNYSKVTGAIIHNFTSVNYKGKTNDESANTIENAIWHEYQALGSKSNRPSFEQFSNTKMKENAIVTVDTVELDKFIADYNHKNVGNQVLIMSALVPDANTKYNSTLTDLLNENVDIKMANGINGKYIYDPNALENEVENTDSTDYVKSEKEKHINTLFTANITYNEYLNILYEEYARPNGYTFTEFSDFLKEKSIISRDATSNSEITLLEISEISVKLLEVAGIKLDGTTYKYMTIPRNIASDKMIYWVKAYNSDLIIVGAPNDKIDYHDGLDIVEQMNAYEKEIENKLQLNLIK